MSVSIQIKPEYARIKLATANRLKIPVTEINGSCGCYVCTTTLLLQISQGSLYTGHKQVHVRAMSVLYECYVKFKSTRYEMLQKIHNKVHRNTI